MMVWWRTLRSLGSLRSGGSHRRKWLDTQSRNWSGSSAAAADEIVRKGIEGGRLRCQISCMTNSPPPLLTIASALREARRSRRMSIAELAASAGVSPRLISEFEQGKRPNVSLETALRLLTLVGVSLHLHDAAEPTDSASARAERAARRRNSWTGTRSTLDAHVDPSAASSSAARLGAVANASALATALQRAARSPRP
jgi:transcriptional regulator with XRE-family HTH domain